jgi:hypothetical protein
MVEEMAIRESSKNVTNGGFQWRKLLTVGRLLSVYLCSRCDVWVECLLETGEESRKD